jgi:hypothetical protein
MNDRVDDLSELLARRLPLSRRHFGRAIAGVGLAGAGLVGADPAAEAKRKKKRIKCKGAVKCGKRCVNPKTDPAHCGGCGRRCGAAQFCDEGTCVDCDVCVAGCAHDSPQAAVAAAGPGATIQVCPGTYGGAVTIGTDLTLRGAGAGRTILDGEETARPLAVAEGATVSVERLTVTKGAAETGGGVLNLGTLEMTACAVVDNAATGSGGFGGDGGGIRNGLGAELTMTGCTIRGNRTGSGFGGGIYNVVDGKLTLNDCTIEENTAVAESGGFGGGVTNFGGRLEVENCTIRGNRSTSASGGIYALNSNNVTITDSEIRDNHGANGGGLGMGGGVVSGCTIVDNRSGGQAGGVSAGTGASFTDCTIAENRAAGDGGGIEAIGTVELTGCVIRDNEASYRGGGLAMVGAVTAEDCVFSGNRAENDGGGIVAHSGALTLAASQVRNNTAGGEGGGIRTYYADVTLQDGSTVSGNDPDNCVGTAACPA